MNNLKNFKQFINESVETEANEGDSMKGLKKQINGYTHFAVRKSNNKIVNGWDYKGIDNDDLRHFKNDYFTMDLKDMDVDHKTVNILTKKALATKGIDILNNSSWEKPGEYSEKEVEEPGEVEDNDSEGAED
jgi:hypothetical protein